MMEYLPEFATVAIAHLLAVASPGPDFAIILRQSLSKGATAAMWTSLGIGAGILVHVTYSLLGLGLLISQSVTLFNILKFIGGAYLLWVGWQCLKAQPAPLDQSALTSATSVRTAWPSFRLGFLTNVLNPKATLFFFALFSVVISPDTPTGLQAFYGIWMWIATTLWFMGLSYLLTRPAVRATFQKNTVWLERVMGVVLMGLAARLFAAKLD